MTIPTILRRFTINADELFAVLETGVEPSMQPQGSLPSDYTTIVVVEGTHEYRQFLQTLINNTQGLRCIATFANAEDALEHIPRLQPHLVLLDIGLPRMSGAQCAERLSISVKTANRHIYNIYEKLHVSSNIEAVAKFFWSSLSYPPVTALLLWRGRSPPVLRRLAARVRVWCEDCPQ